ncbi:hypothetical protein J6590_097068 [Homalodisca vitripennis]|nr:hypothetical protein J6590_097068 [Homalodisca vitripennis]
MPSARRARLALTILVINDDNQPLPNILQRQLFLPQYPARRANPLARFVPWKRHTLVPKFNKILLFKNPKTVNSSNCHCSKVSGDGDDKCEEQKAQDQASVGKRPVLDYRLSTRHINRVIAAPPTPSLILTNWRSFSCRHNFRSCGGSKSCRQSNGGSAVRRRYISTACSTIPESTEHAASGKVQRSKMVDIMAPISNSRTSGEKSPIPRSSGDESGGQKESPQRHFGADLSKHTFLATDVLSLSESSRDLSWENIKHTCLPYGNQSEKKRSIYVIGNVGTIIDRCPHSNITPSGTVPPSRAHLNCTLPRSVILL